MNTCKCCDGTLEAESRTPEGQMYFHKALEERAKGESGTYQALINYTLSNNHGYYPAHNNLFIVLSILGSRGLDKDTVLLKKYVNSIDFSQTKDISTIIDRIYTDNPEMYHNITMDLREKIMPYVKKSITCILILDDIEREEKKLPKFYKERSNSILITNTTENDL